MLKSGKITKIKLLHSLYGEVVLGLQHLSQALPSSSITELDIDYRSCSDVGLEHLIKQLPSTSLTTFRIRGLYTRLNFRSLFEVLPSTGITTLDVKVLTDEDLQCLTNNLPSTNITTLCCGWFDEVSDAGLQCLSTVLPSTKITSLNFSSDYSEYEDRSDIILRYLCESLPSTNVTTFSFHLSSITDQGLRYVCEALTSPKLKTLKGHCQHNCNTCSGLEDLYQALQSSTITTFELYLDCNPELMSSFCIFLPRIYIPADVLD